MSDYVVRLEQRTEVDAVTNKTNPHDAARYAERLYPGFKAIEVIAGEEQLEVIGRCVSCGHVVFDIDFYHMNEDCEYLCDTCVC